MDFPMEEPPSVVRYRAAFDVQGAIVSIDPEVEALTGYSSKEWVTDPHFWARHVVPEDYQALLPTLVRAHRGRGRFTAEYRLIDREGRRHWIHDEGTLVRGPKGQPLYIEGVWLDVTGRKLLEAEAARQKRRGDAAEAELAQFVSLASHGLRTPVRQIRSLAGLAKRRLARSPKECEALLSDIIADAERAEEILRGLVVYAEAGRAAPSPRDVEMSAVLSLVLRGLKDVLEAAQAEVTAGDLPTVRTDPAIVERVLHDLIDNAVKFGGPAPRVHVWAKRGRDRWLFCVKDEGPGIPLADNERVFQVFTRLEPRGASSGLGLGLATARKLLSRLGGRLWLRSEAGEGAAFYFTLPDDEGGS